MYFIFELGFTGKQHYIAGLIRAYARSMGVDLRLKHQNGKILFSLKRDNDQLEALLHRLEEVLPASLYLGSSRHYFSDTPVEETVDMEAPLPVSIAPCPTCQIEMFDVSSRRYYYPFTSCSNCGAQHPFVEHYPYTRDNTLMRFFTPCPACSDELQHNSLRKDYPLISCIACGVSVKMTDGKSERYANDKGEYRKLFEVSARALSRGKTVLMKTLHGYRKFFLPEGAEPITKSTLLMCDANVLHTHLMMVPQEFNALLSIERPLLRIATRSEALQRLYGSSALVKYPDEGMSMLLARELINHGMAYIAYEESHAQAKADFLVDFDLPIHFQRDTKLFINQDTRLFVTGERILFPMVVSNPKHVTTVAHDLAAVTVQGETRIDSVDLFDSAHTLEIRILRNELLQTGHANEVRFEQWQASMLSVLQEHDKLGEKAVGVHFDTQLYFLYYNGRKVISVIPPNRFESDHIWERIQTLREGSDRLVANYQKRYPETYERLDNLQVE